MVFQTYPLPPSMRISESRSRSRSRSRGRATDGDNGDEYRRFSSGEVLPQRRASLNVDSTTGAMAASVASRPSTLKRFMSSMRSASMPASPPRSTCEPNRIAEDVVITNKISSSPSPSVLPSPSRSFCTENSTYHVNTRQYKGFSTPFCGILQTSMTLAIANDMHHVDNHEMRSSTWEQEEREMQTSHLRTDLCSLTLFGILQADFTRYLFTHTRPPSLFKRCCLHLLTPLTIFLVAGWCSGHIRNDYVNNALCTTLVWFIIIWIIMGCIRGRKKRVMLREEILWRLQRREDRLRKHQQENSRGRKRGLFELTRVRGEEETSTSAGAGEAEAEAEEYEYYSEDEEEYHKYAAKLKLADLGQSRFEMNCAHRMCGCYPSDSNANGVSYGGTSHHASLPYQKNVDENNYTLQRTDRTPIHENSNTCTVLSSILSSPCIPCLPCGNNSYGCHPQFCGFCGIAQEAREANLTLPRHLRMVDYISMEPFLFYYPRILELRQLKSNSLLDHCRALSVLSTTLLQAWTVILIVLLGLSLWDAIGYWKLADMAVLFATFIQAFGVIYIVHWGWHRHDLSVDAIIKYFACGFISYIGMTMVLEVLTALFRLLVAGVILVLGVNEVQDNGFGGDSDMRMKMDKQIYGYTDQVHRVLSKNSDVLNGFFYRHPFAKIFFVFISCYLVCGVIEEATKYIGFVMVDHPDFCSERELAKAKASLPFQLLRDKVDEEEQEQGHTTHHMDQSHENSKPIVQKNTDAILGTNEILGSLIFQFDPSLQRRTPVSIRAAVTVAMVAVALGFAFCENLLLIFIYNRSSYSSEVGMLVVKSLFPIHPIAAAIQSIQVCRRDLEHKSSIGIGRILLPSVIFHGSYDFVLLTINSSWDRKENYFYQHENDRSRISIISCLMCLVIVGTGCLYYVLRSRAQYLRLSGRLGQVMTGSSSLENAFLT